jgi:hypothetical protein
MATQIVAKVGKKLTEEQKKNLDPKKVKKLTATPTKADVEPEIVEAQVCPYCGCIGYGDVIPGVWLYYTCHCCGRTFLSEG